MKKVLVIAMIFAGVIAFGNEKKVININTFETEPYSTENWQGFDDLVVKEAFKRIDYEVNFVKIPAVERAIFNADTGIDDGTYSRVKGTIALYKNLVVVNEPIGMWEAMVFSKKANFNVNGWESVNPYDVGYIKGWKILESNIKNAKSLTLAIDENNLFDLLINDRVDIIIDEKYQGINIVNKKRNKEIRVLDKPIVAATMHLFLNKKHAEILPKLEKALKAMKNDGTYDKIKRETLKEFSQKQE